MLDKRILKRRRMIGLGLGALVATGTATLKKSGLSQQSGQQPGRSKRSFSLVKKDTTLKQRAAVKGLIFGAASRYKDLVSDPKLSEAFIENCAMLVPEWELKWSAGSSLLRPSPDAFDFTQGDWMAEFAQTHHLLLQGHTLVWHNSLPQWFSKTVNAQNAEQFLRQHIQTVVQHYRGQMHSWCVVNEAIAYDPRKGRADGLQDSPWLKFLGPKYIDLAFQIAAKADPKAMLFYNDYGLDYDNPLDEAKRTAVLKLLERFKTTGTPIHALGIQAHLKGEATEFNPRKLRSFLKDVSNLGLKIMITELDVNDQRLPASSNVRDSTIAGIYEDYLTAALDEPAVIAVITWGLSDRYTYLSELPSRIKNRDVRPLPLDVNLKPKLAWNAIARSFDAAPKR